MSRREEAQDKNEHHYILIRLCVWRQVHLDFGRHAAYIAACLLGKGKELTQDAKCRRARRKVQAHNIEENLAIRGSQKP
jgi:hypothetical protein